MLKSLPAPTPSLRPLPVLPLMPRQYLVIPPMPRPPPILPSNSFEAVIGMKVVLAPLLRFRTGKEACNWDWAGCNRSGLLPLVKIPPQPRQHPIPLPSAEGFPVLPPIPRLPLRTLLLLEHPRFPRKRFPLLAQRMLPGILPQLRQLLSFSRILS